MPAPTALIKKSNAEEASEIPLPEITEEEKNDIFLDLPSQNDQSMELDAHTNSNEITMNSDGAPIFSPSKDQLQVTRVEVRKCPIPPHRMSPLRANWSKLYPPLVNHLKLQCRFNVKTKAVELRTSKFTEDTGALQKGEDFVKAFALGFDIDDAVALLRVDGLYIQTFEIKDIKTLQGDHLGRAIGRIAGKDGKTKWSIENSTKTRIVLQESKISILGAYKNIGMARESIVDLIRGKAPGKVYQNLRTISSKLKEQF